MMTRSVQYRLTFAHVNRKIKWDRVKVYVHLQKDLTFKKMLPAVAGVLRWHYNMYYYIPEISPYTLPLKRSYNKFLYIER